MLHIVALYLAAAAPAAGPEKLKYNNPGLTVDLGVGLWAWPLPMDYDGDGDPDLVVSCPDVPSNGTWFFENPGGKTFPVFKPGVRIGPGRSNVRVSRVDGRPRVLGPAVEYAGFREHGYGRPRTLGVPARVRGGKLRANQWHYGDWDGDGRTDLIVGVGSWEDYGWDDAFNADGEWTRGPLHGWVYLLRNTGTNQKPDYAEPRRLEAGGTAIDVYGMPSPNLADFDGDGDADLLCGSFTDRLTYFQNTGSRTAPAYAAGRELIRDGKPLRMELCMIVPVAFDWDGDGDVDLVVGEEDGRVSLLEHTGQVAGGMPQFLPPRPFRQEADAVKFGALVTPAPADWDDDGDTDLVCGNTAGFIGFIENLDGGDPPRWAAPVRLAAGGAVIRIQAGPNGSIQGPCETKWGYTTLDVADWDGDGRTDIVANSIRGTVVWFRNRGKRGAPALEPARPVRVQWKGTPPKPAWNWWDPADGTLVTQWRTSPEVIDLDRDGLVDLVMLDCEGYLCLFRRAENNGRRVLLPPERIFTAAGNGPLRLNGRRAGKSGRRKLRLVDWDGDGRLDLLVDSRSVDFYRNTAGEPGRFVFVNTGPVTSRRLAGHTTSPALVDWDGDGNPDLLIGAEDGFLYYLASDLPVAVTPAALKAAPAVTVSGRGFTTGVLKNGATAYGNRRYVWRAVPAALAGWRFTRTDGGERAAITAVPAADGHVYAATCTRQDGIDMAGWEETGLTFHYTDRGRSVMTVFRKKANTGEKVTIPQGNWTGGVVLAPSLAAAHAPPPGVVIARSPDFNRVYIGCPAIAVLDDGRYVAAHSFFGPGSKYNRMVVYRSADRGETWRRLTDVRGQFWSSLFTHRGALYLMGNDGRYGNVVIRRSTDGGATWTDPRGPDTGLLIADGGYHCAPVPVTVHGGRIWRAMEDNRAGGGWGKHFRAFMLSAPADADLLKAAHWTSSNRLHFDPQWFKAKRPGWLEGNAVAAPDGQMLNILRFNDDRGDRAAICRVSADGKKMTCDPATGMIDFPGGRNKFTIRRDAKTGRYWSLVNKETSPPAYRNRVALTSSADLRHWRVEWVALRHPDRKHHAWQYLDWLFDGDDIIAVSRTAWDGSHNAHDANYLTFHRIADFRKRTKDDPPLWGGGE